MYFSSPRTTFKPPIYQTRRIIRAMSPTISAEVAISPFRSHWIQGRRRFSKILRLLLLAFCLLYSMGATYYVDNTGGNDSWNGLSQSHIQTHKGPWQHVSMVNKIHFSPGDQILFKRGGIWREMLVIPSSGLPGRPITFGAYGSGNPPIIDGGLIRETLVCKRSWVILKDLELRNSDKAGLLIQSQRGQDLGHVTIERIISHDSARDGIVVMNNNNLAPAHNYQITNVIIKECTSYNNGHHGIAIDDNVSNCLIAYNKVYNNGLRPIAEYGWHGITLYGENADNKPNNIIIEHNEVSKQQQGIVSRSKEGAGIQCDDNAENVIIRYNYCKKNKGPGINLHIAENIKIYYNILAHNGSNNYGDAGLSINNSNNVKAYNNVIYNNNAYGIYISYNSFRRGITRNITLANNIIYNDINNPKMRAMRVWTRSGRLFPKFVSTHNCWFFVSAGKPMIEWLETGLKTFTQYQAISRQDRSPFSFEASPRFLDAAGGNFHLRSDSACLNKGANFGLTRDFEGKPVPSGAAPAIGVYETATPFKPSGR